MLFMNMMQSCKGNMSSILPACYHTCYFSLITFIVIFAFLYSINIFCSGI